MIAQTNSTALSDCHFPAYVIIRARLCLGLITCMRNSYYAIADLYIHSVTDIHIYQPHRSGRI